MLPPKQELRVITRTVKLEINFETDQATIKNSYAPDLQGVADYLAQHSKTKAVIEGYTDNVGSRSYNQDLSIRRAEAVKDYLVNKLGVAAERLETVGYGFDRPVASNETEAGRAENRHIVVNFFE